MKISAIGQTVDELRLFPSFAMEPFQSFGAKSLGLRSTIFDALRCLCTNILIEISLDVSVTK